MIRFEDLVKVFTLSENEQAQYFPQLTKPLFVVVKGLEIETQHSRMIALCALNAFAQENESRQGELGRVCFEIASLSNLMIEVSGIYDWLVMHPNEVKNLRDTAIVDSSIYGVWCIIRRLCNFLEHNWFEKGELKPFEELFSEIIQ